MATALADPLECVCSWWPQPSQILWSDSSAVIAGCVCTTELHLRVEKYWKQWQWQSEMLLQNNTCWRADATGAVTIWCRGATAVYWHCGPQKTRSTHSCVASPRDEGSHEAWARPIWSDNVEDIWCFRVSLSADSADSAYWGIQAFSGATVFSKAAGISVSSSRILSITDTWYTWTHVSSNVALSLRVNYTDWATATCWRNLVPTFADRGMSRGQRGGSPTVSNLQALVANNQD
jgi:hypothetical protein